MDPGPRETEVRFAAVVEAFARNPPRQVRLQVFRALVVAGQSGMTPGTMAEGLSIPANTLSFHLKELTHAGLVTQERASRNIIYRAAFAHMNALLGYLTENCCQSAIQLRHSEGCSATALLASLRPTCLLLCLPNCVGQPSPSWSAGRLWATPWHQARAEPTSKVLRGSPANGARRTPELIGRIQACARRPGRHPQRALRLTKSKESHERRSDPL